MKKVSPNIDTWKDYKEMRDEEPERWKVDGYPFYRHNGNPRLEWLVDLGILEKTSSNFNADPKISEIYDALLKTKENYAEPFLVGEGFYEYEIFRKVEQYGNLAHVWSTYGSKKSKFDAKPYARGINSIQLLYDDHRWWVISIYYNKETFPMGINSSFPQNCQLTIPLDPFSALSGATAYYPGSQQNLHYPKQDDDFSNLKQMLADPGDLVFFNGNCWHGAMPNKSDHQRAALLIEFLPKYIKPVEDLTTYLDDDFKKNSSERVKQLLGLNYEYPKIMDTSKSVNQIGIGYKAK